MISANVSDGRRNAARNPSAVGEMAMCSQNNSFPVIFPVVLSGATVPRSGAVAESKDPYADYSAGRSAGNSPFRCNPILAVRLPPGANFLSMCHGSLILVEALHWRSSHFAQDDSGKKQLTSP